MGINHVVRSAALSGALALALLVAACGGGGGGSTSGGVGNSLPPSTGPGDAANFFPDTPGDTWNYFVTATDPLSSTSSSFLDAVRVTGSKSVNGTVARVFVESNPSGSGVAAEGYYFKNGGGVAFLGTNDPTDKVTPALVPNVVALFPVAPGMVAQLSRTGLDFGLDLDGDGVNESVNLSLTNSVVGFEPLTLGLGSFARTVRSSEVTTGSVVLSATRTSIAIASTLTRWSAPGVGVVRTSQSTTVDSMTFDEVMELRGYTVGGTAHGFGLPFTALNNLPLNLLPVSDAPALATDGQNFLAASEGSAGLTAKPFDARGQAINNAALASTTGSAFSTEAFDGTNYWVFFSPYSNGTSGSVNACFAQRVSAAGNLVDINPITVLTLDPAFSSISSAAFAFGTSSGLLVYSAFNLSTSQHELHGVLVDAAGAVLGGGSFPIATDNSTHLNPAVVFDGSNFFVVWMQLATSGATDGHIYGVRVSPAGAVIETSPIAISTAPVGQSSPSAAFDGTNVLVVWLDLRNQSDPHTFPKPDVYAARVSPSAGLIDGPAATGGLPINVGGDLERAAPKVAFTGSEYLVTWASLGFAVNGSPGVLAARVTTDGTLPAGAGRTIAVSGPPSAATGSHFSNPVMAAGAQRAAVVWFDNQNALKALVGASFFSP